MQPAPMIVSPRMMLATPSYDEVGDDPGEDRHHQHDREDDGQAHGRVRAGSPKYCRTRMLAPARRLED